MSKKTELINYGNILFLIGILITIIGAKLKLSDENSTIVIATLIILGIGVGILNITSKETVPFMVSGIAIVLLLQPFLTLFSKKFGIEGSLLMILGGLYVYLTSFIIPAVLVVALKTCFKTAKD